MGPLTVLFSPWEGFQRTAVNKTSFVGLNCRQPGPVNMAFGVAHHPGDLGKFFGAAEVLCAEACFLCEYLLWSVL